MKTVLASPLKGTKFSTESVLHTLLGKYTVMMVDYGDDALWAAMTLGSIRE